MSTTRQPLTSYRVEIYARANALHDVAIAMPKLPIERWKPLARRARHIARYAFVGKFSDRHLTKRLAALTQQIANPNQITDCR
jgi:hypothetical protein